MNEACLATLNNKVISSIHVNIKPFGSLIKTSKAFNIVGIGQVLTGEIVDGVIDAGYFIRLNSISYKIDSVEAIDYISSGTAETALIFDIATDDFQTALDGLLGQTVTITPLPNPH